MSRHHLSLFRLALFLLAVLCSSSAQTSPATDASSPDKMTNQTRILVIKSLQAERVFSKVIFPQGEKGLKIKNGVVSPSQAAIAQQVAENGAAAKPGDRCVISDIKITEKSIVLEINGGPKKKGKWYQHIEVGGMGGGTSPVPGASPQSLDAHGSVVTLEFDKHVPEISGDQVRAMLAPVFDFKALTASEAYEKTLPPKVQAAIRDHKVLVGMDKEMVTYAKGRPQQRIRDKDDQGNDYEEWIYGKPPEEVDFVRFKGNEVARLEIMTVDGKKEIRTVKEVELPNQEAELAEQKPAAKPQAPPTLRRPGEEPEPAAPPAGRRLPGSQGQGQGTNTGSNSPYPNGSDPTATPPINPNPVPHLAPAS